MSTEGEANGKYQKEEEEEEEKKESALPARSSLIFLFLKKKEEGTSDGALRMAHPSQSAACSVEYIF